MYTCVQFFDRQLLFICSTGKSLSEALIFASTNPQYDERLFIELHVQYMKIPSWEHGENILCTEIVYDIQNNFCTQHVLPMFSNKKSFWQRFTCKLNTSCFHEFWIFNSIFFWCDRSRKKKQQTDWVGIQFCANFRLSQVILRMLYHAPADKEENH